ncbi:MAG: ABC transporter ATP-binding protein [Cyanobacteriota bacterium]|nr:ABC transporter ATP-binding protein [Cyanobacteriota bacterium]
MSDGTEPPETTASPVTLSPDLSRARYGTLLRLLWTHITPRRRLQLLLLVLLMVLSSFAELLSVASLVPFLAALSDPAGLWRQPWLRPLATVLGITSPEQWILPTTLLLMGAGVASAGIRATNLFVNARLSALIGSDLAVEGYRRTLEQPYLVHLGRNSSEVITRLAYLGGVSRSVLAPLLLGLSGLIVAITLVSGLLLYQPTLALGLAMVFLLSYGSLVRLNRRRLHSLSSKANIFSQQSLKAQQEGMGAIRDVLLEGSQAMVIANFRQAERPLRLVEAEADTISGLPRFALEAVGMVGIAGSVLWLLPRGGVVAALPAVGSIALGFQRLLPAVQQMYGASTYLGAYRDRLAAGLELLEQPHVTQGHAQNHQHEPLPFQRSLTFRDVEFQHQPGRPVLQEIAFSVHPGEWIGLVGPTGSGKSTLLDLLMGLLSPCRGQILVDGMPLEDRDAAIDRRQAWQRHLAHVPQTIFLADASIGANIAFGVAPETIDHQRLIWAATASQSEEFITSLPLGFDTPVGERGVRLSGGQRQRLGIARALYKKSDVLILDEATSALDTATEKAVIDSLWRLGKHLTVVMVAHRLGTLSRCQKIIEVHRGKIQSIGNYSEFLNSQKHLHTSD